MKTIRAFRGSIVHVHVKDSRWVDGRYERTMLGAGSIDYGWVTSTLEADGYRGAGRAAGGPARGN
jgi:sugar phosphate isomerase/epimerase